MRFLITGITGFAAPHLANVIRNDGHEVYGMYRGLNIQIHKKVEDTINPDKIVFVYGDLTNQESIDMIFKDFKFDGVFHLGAFAHPPSSFVNPELALKTNAMGMAYLCRAIKEHNPECVLMQCSTPEVYGICPADKKIDETTPMNPMNPYGVSKASADMYLAERIRNGEVRGFFTRAFSHTGPRRRENFSISSDAIQIARILKGKQEPIIKVGNLKSQRVVADVRDIVEAYYGLMLLALKGEINGEIFHIAGNELHDIGYYLNLMLECFNVMAELVVDDNLYRPIDIPVQIPDDSKVRKLLNWKPSIPIEKTLKDLVDYWLEKI
jgi:GDP-4-dehydro-6-deoxy-D-mannose reductase